MTDDYLLMANMTEDEYLAYDAARAAEIDAAKAAEIERLADVEGSPHP